jgi:hypothetical protein
MNKDHYTRIMQNKVSNSLNRQDRRFYKKRIVDLTRDLLSKPSEHEKNVFIDVKFAFDNYIKTCVNYFKSIDNNDILQEEYKNFDPDDCNQNDASASNEKENKKHEADKLLMRSVKMGNPLDKFVKRKMLKVPDPPVIPKQKDIDLADPELKNKGIIKRKKKENIA